jgi:hypothetical protein
MQVELGQYRPGVGCAAVVVRPDRDPERRLVLACAMPAERLASTGQAVRARLVNTAREIASVLTDGPDGLVAV